MKTNVDGRLVLGLGAVVDNQLPWFADVEAWRREFEFGLVVGFQCGYFWLQVHVACSDLLQLKVLRPYLVWFLHNFLFEFEIALIRIGSATVTILGSTPAKKPG